MFQLKIMKIKILIVIVLYLNINSYSQQIVNSYSKHIVKSYKTYPTFLPYKIEFNFAYERSLNRKTAIEVLIGSSLKENIFFRKDSFFDLDNDDYPQKFIIAPNALVRLSYKYYLGENGQFSEGYYIASQLFTKLTYLNNYTYKNYYEGEYKENIDLTKGIIGLHLLFGKQYVDRTNVLINWYIGIGARYTPYFKTRYWEEYYPPNYDLENTTGYYYRDEVKNIYYWMLRPSLHFGLGLGILR